MNVPVSRVVFVLGKGGVGRSTIATALALSLAEGGESVLVLEWTLAEGIAPWFGQPAAGTQPFEIAPGVSVANYDLGEALRAYFVDHLRVGFFYRHVVATPALHKLIDAAPGIAEMLFLGQLWWLTTLAEKEAGLRFDRIIVDAPATGHGASLLDLAGTLRSMGAGGLLRKEIERVGEMMSDPAWTSSIVVSLAQQLATEETLELVPRVTRTMGRPPIFAVINRSVTHVVTPAGREPWLDSIESLVSPTARATLETLHEELQSRAAHEATLSRALEGTTRAGVVSIDEMLAMPAGTTSREVAYAVAGELGAFLRGGT